MQMQQPYASATLEGFSLKKLFKKVAHYSDPRNSILLKAGAGLILSKDIRKGQEQNQAAMQEQSFSYEKMLAEQEAQALDFAAQRDQFKKALMVGGLGLGAIGALSFVVKRRRRR